MGFVYSIRFCSILLGINSMKYDCENFSVYPIFFPWVSTTKIDENLDNLFVELKKFGLEQIPETEDAYMTKNITVLNRFPDTKKLFEDKVQKLLNSVFNITNDIAMTTSWLTQTKPNGHGGLHNHQNSYMSAIFYPEMVKKDQGCLFFSDQNIRHAWFYPDQLPDKKINPFNASSFEIEPEKNTMVIFPSYLQHGIKYNKSDVDRYSLAMNFILVGKFGHGDSTLNISINDEEMWSEPWVDDY